VNSFGAKIFNRLKLDALLFSGIKFHFGLTEGIENALGQEASFSILQHVERVLAKN